MNTISNNNISEVIINDKDEDSLINVTKLSDSNIIEEEKTLEELIALVDDVDYALRISEEAASADGLDIRENFALERCYRLISEKLSPGEENAKGD